MDQLAQYIITQEQAGYSENQIKQALFSQGYQKQQIEQAFASLGPSKDDPIIHEYVQQYAQQGLTQQQIISQLQSQGYPANKIRKAISQVYGTPEHHGSTIVFILIALLVGAGGMYLLMHTDNTPAPAPTTGGVTELSPQEQIASVLTIANMQGKDAAIHACQDQLTGGDRDLCLLDVAITDKINDDRICDQIVGVELKDKCLMNFIDTRAASVCKRVQLKSNIQSCSTILALQNAKGT